MYSLDASLVDLRLSLFPWAHFCKSKAAVKLHVGLDHQGLLPAFATVTHGHTSDLEVARTLNLPKGSILVCDRGYLFVLLRKQVDLDGDPQCQYQPEFMGQWWI